MTVAHAGHGNGGIIAGAAAVEPVALVDDQAGGGLGAVFRQVVGHGVIRNGIPRPAEVHGHAYAGPFRAVTHGDEQVVYLNGEGALPDGLAGDHAGGAGIVEHLALAQHDGGRIIKLDDMRRFVVMDLQDGKGGVGHLAHRAHRQRAGNGGYALLQGDAAGDHGAQDLGGQRGENIGLHAAAQAIGQDQGQVLIAAAVYLHLVAAQGLTYMVQADPACFNP